MPRLVAVLVVLVLVAGCTTSREVSVELGDPGGDGGSATTPPTDAGGRDGSGGAGSPSTSATRRRSPPPTNAPAEPPRAEAERGDDGSTGGPGAFARTLLRPQPATTVVFERLEQSGAAPRRATVDHAKSVLRSVTAKPVADPPPIPVPGGAQEWTAESIRDTADRLTKAGQGGGRAVLHVLFLRGNLRGNDEVLGVAVRGDVVAIFSDSVAAAGTPLVSGGAIEDAVLIHELGHLLGLVDLVLDTGRADPEHPGHSRNRDSVMYWAVESSLVTQVLAGGPPRDFDSQDLADLAALRNGA
ncbi:MAG: hypothetical protein KY439_00485 [Actinobacteria bacterium]|nr:hypothetical protein [Actinomycetota bacterium]